MNIPMICPDSSDVFGFHLSSVLICHWSYTSLSPSAFYLGSFFPVVALISSGIIIPFPVIPERIPFSFCLKRKIDSFR